MDSTGIIIFIGFIVVGVILYLLCNGRKVEQEKTANKSHHENALNLSNSNQKTIKTPKPLIDTYFEDLIILIQTAYDKWLKDNQDSSCIKKSLWPHNSNIIFFFHLLSAEIKRVYHSKVILTDFTIKFLAATESASITQSDFFTNTNTIYSIYGPSVNEYEESCNDLPHKQKRKMIIEKLLKKQEYFLDFDYTGESRVSIFGYFSKIISIAYQNHSFDQQMKISDELFDIENCTVEIIKNKLTLIMGYYYLSLSDEEKSATLNNSDEVKNDQKFNSKETYENEAPSTNAPPQSVNSSSDDREHVRVVKNHIKNYVSNFINEIEKDSSLTSCKDDLVRAIKNRLEKIRDLHTVKMENIEEISLALLCDIAFNLLASGEYHFYVGELDPLRPGKSMYKVYVAAMNRAVELGFNDEKSKNETIKYLNQCISEVG